MIIITAQNATPEVKARFLQEYRDYRDQQKGVIRLAFAMPVTDWDQEPPAVVAGRQRMEERKRQVRTLLARQPHLSSLITFIEEHGLIYTKLSDYQHRIKHPGTDKFVDWWDGKNKTMSDNGRWGKQGKNQAFLLQAVTKLAGGKN